MGVPPEEAAGAEPQAARMRPPAGDASSRRTEDRQQVRAVSGAPVADAGGPAPRAVTGNLRYPVGDLHIPSALGDQPIATVASGTAALPARDPERCELADQVAEDDRPVSGH